MKDKSYIKYEVSGISGVQLKNGFKYEINNEVIDSIIVDKELKSITLYFKEDKFDKIIEKRCSDFVEEYLLRLCIHPDIKVDNPSFKVSTTYIKNIQKFDTLTINEFASVKDSVSIIRIYNEDSFYNNILNNDKLNLNFKTSLDYKRLMSILKNPNKVTRYLLLYELLLDLTSRDKKRKEQKNVVDFIKKYKDQTVNKEIKFYKIRRKGDNFYEDAFTYYRNEIAHAEFEDDYESYEKLTNDLSHSFINSLIEIINFAIIKCA